MSVNKLQNLVQRTNNMIVPSFTLTHYEIESLKQNGTSKKGNISTTPAISAIKKNESTYTKTLNITIRKGASNNIIYNNTAPYNYHGNTLNQLPKY